MNEQGKDINAVIESLNPQQKEATLNIKGPELIIAGAGSGKTRVLTARIALLMNSCIMPERILALTFTKKAAEEMRHRIAETAGADAVRLRMGTFHSVFITFIRPWASYIGFPHSFTIMDEDDSLSCLKRCINAVLEEGRLPAERRTKEMIEEYKAKDSYYKPKLIKNKISKLKNNLIDPRQYDANESAKAADAALCIPLFSRIYGEYVTTCRRSATMDFDDILLYTFQLMDRCEAARRQISSMFDYILVDEYQDTNLAQYAILMQLTTNNHNICVVGDDSQSIYAFRGARIENILNFEKEFPNCKVVKLERNYRSTQNIVSAANRLIRHNETRIDKECFSGADEGEEPELHQLADERDEASFVASTIDAIKKKDGLGYRDFAVLYRTNAQSRALEDAMVRRRIPYVIYSGTSFFQRKEIKDTMAYFRLAVNPHDDEAFRRVVNLPARGVGEAAMTRLCQMARTYGMSLWQTASGGLLPFVQLGKNAEEGVLRFVSMIKECADIAATEKPYDAAKKISGMTGFADAYLAEGNEESRDRANNIRELLDSARAYEEDTLARAAQLDEKNAENPTLSGYLQNVQLLSNADTGVEGDRVNMMTVHCAKGLEFDTVFVTGMEEDLFPLRIDNTDDEEEEERRLMYVASTRAKKNLILTSADRRLRFGTRKNANLSKFLFEMGVAKTEGRDDDEEEDEK